MINKSSRFPIKQMSEQLQDNKVLWVQHKLYQQYSSSQSYFYSSKITNIVRSKRTQATLYYDDLECLFQDEEMLKREYQKDEYPRKMAAFREYYYYHEDCPRIFTKGVNQVYERWHEKRRDIVYKKLKQMFNESYSSYVSSEDNNGDQDLPPVSHFLLDISQFNPYSKKYYLRVQARQQKEKEQRERRKAQKTKTHLSGLQHDLSMMLTGMNDISGLSTVMDSNEGIIARYQTSNQDDKLSSVKSKMLFKKKKSFMDQNKNSDTIEKTNSVQATPLKHKKNSSSEAPPRQPVIISQLKLVPKDALLQQKLLGEMPKTRSIISISSFKKNNPSSHLPQHLPQNKKNDFKVPKLALKSQNFQTNPQQKSVSKKVISIYNSQGKIKSRSTTKITPAHQNRQFSLKKLQAPSYLRHNDVDQFTDRKLAEATGLVSYKSEQTGFGSTSSSQRRIQQANSIKVKLFHKN